MVTFILNGREVQAEEGSTILQVAEANGIHIPTLCKHEALEPAGLCRLCTVEVSKGTWSRLVTSCNYPIWQGVEVATDSQEVFRHRKMIVELLLARCPNNGFVKGLASAFGVKTPRFETDDDHCILCGLCVRVCQRMGPCILAFSGRGTKIELASPHRKPSDACMGCGSCVLVCPTGYIRRERIEEELVICTPDFSIARIDLEKCTNCGTPFATRKYLDYVKERSKAGEWVFPETVLCPSCGRSTRAEGIALGEAGVLATD